jgi:hypothetical protein
MNPQRPTTIYLGVGRDLMDCGELPSSVKARSSNG